MFKGFFNKFLLSYRIIFPKDDYLSEVVRALHKAGISFRVRRNAIYLSGESYKRVIGSLDEGRMEASSDFLGIFGFIKGLLRRKGVAFGLVIIFILSFFSCNTVFDIRIDGLESITEEKILSELAQNGFSVGSSWLGADIKKTESALLAASDDIGWISINRRGSVAYVEIREKSIDDIPSYKYSNIVAGYDCIIEDITVTHGYARVDVGDTVKKGDVLISGIPENEGEPFCAAEGVIIGRVNDTVYAYEDRILEEKCEKYDGIVGFSVKIFKKTINIFKIYGNSTDKYDIIENKYNYKLYGKRIPISFSTYTKTDFEIVKTEKTDEELIRSVSKRTAELVLSVTETADLVSLKSHGRLTTEGYLLCTEVVFLKDVSVTVPFDLE